MKKMLLMICLLTNAAYADDLYKCVKEGHKLYQSTPCDGTSIETQLQSTRAFSMPGCYATDMPGFENGFEIKETSDDHFTLDSSNSDGKQSIPMKRATPEELHTVGAAFHLKLREGVSMKWEEGTPNQKPIGVYKGKDTNGNEVVFAFLFFANGLVTEATCK